MRYQRIWPYQNRIQNFETSLVQTFAVLTSGANISKNGLWKCFRISFYSGPQKNYSQNIGKHSIEEIKFFDFYGQAMVKRTRLVFRIIFDMHWKYWQMAALKLWCCLLLKTAHFPGHDCLINDFELVKVTATTVKYSKSYLKPFPFPGDNEIGHVRKKWHKNFEFSVVGILWINLKIINFPKRSKNLFFLCILIIINFLIGVKKTHTESKERNI